MATAPDILVPPESSGPGQLSQPRGLRQRLMSTLAYVTAGADAGKGWAAQITFLQTEIGDTYMKTLATEVDRYIQAL